MDRLRKLLQAFVSIWKRPGIRNGMWLYLLQFFNTIIPLITLPYITRVLSTTGFGVYSIALNIIGYYQVAVEYGFGMSATRKVAINDKNHALIEQTFSRVLCARVFLTAVCTAISVVLFVTGIMNGAGICILVMLISIVGYCVQQNWLFQGMQDMKFISIVSIIGRIVSTVLVFVLVKEESDLVLYCLLFSISPFISGIMGLLIAKRRYELKFSIPSVEGILSELKDGFFVFTTQLSSKVFGAIGITFLGMFCSPETVGIYSAIQKVPHIIMLLWSPISQVLYPIASKRLEVSYSEGKKYVLRIRRIMLLAFGAISVLVAIVSRQVVEIAFGTEYVVSAYWIIPLLGWLLIGINNNFLGIQLLLGSGHDKEYSKCFQIGVVATVGFNLLLILMFGGDGAAIAPMFSEIVLWLLLHREVTRLDKTYEDSL